MANPRTKWVLSVLASAALTLPVMAGEPKPRIIVLTDISPITVEPDDFESTIRLLAHADLFEIEGLVATTGWSNSGGSEHPEILKTIIDAYEKDSPNLLKRSSQSGFQKDEARQEIGYWPSPAYLRDKTVMGSRKMGMQFIGENNNSPGSDLIIKMADEKDERPIYVLVWGGGNTLAQAIWKVQQERTPDQLKQFLQRIRVYTITDQDRPQRGGDPKFSSHYWMRKEFSKDMKFIWDESAWNYQNGTGKSNWDKYAADIQGKGNLGAIYPKYKYGVEGDTPSFLYVHPNGLNDPENPTFGGWGGMFVWGISSDKETECFVNQGGTSIRAASRKYEQRFYPAIYNNFVARMDWAKDGKGNRNPNVVVNGDKTLKIIKLTPALGASVTLDASATTDPDGDKLTYSWWVMTEAGTYTKEVEISGKDTSKATLKAPADSAGKSFHVICEVTDNGAPNLTSYRRIIIEPSGAATARGQTFENWLFQYIPVQYKDARMTDHVHWKQAHVTDQIVASWHQWNDKEATLKLLEGHGLTQGKTIFIEKKEKNDWAKHPAATYYEGAGYYISGYDSAAMSGWKVEGLTVIQFDGDAKELARTLATAWAKGTQASSGK